MLTEPLLYSIDIGDSVIRSGVYINGRTFLVDAVPTPKEEGLLDRMIMDAELWSVVRQVITDLTKRYPNPAGIAVSASGTMTLQPRPRARNYGPFKDSEVLVTAPNVEALTQTPLIACVERLGFGIPVHLENDMNAAITAATAFDDAILIGLGAGLGAAIKRDGRVQHLPGTWSCFEVGHGARWPLSQMFTRQCRCGTTGCLEAAIGGWAMTERYIKAPEDAPPAMYDAMRNDVVALLPQVMAKLAGSTDIPTILLAGLGSIGYSINSDFIERLTQATNELLAGRLAVSIEVVDLGEAAELHGAALALLANNVLESAPSSQSGGARRNAHSA